jgi:hypothetical protein
MSMSMTKSDVVDVVEARVLGIESLWLLLLLLLLLLCVQQWPTPAASNDGVDAQRRGHQVGQVHRGRVSPGDYSSMEPLPRGVSGASGCMIDGRGSMPALRACRLCRRAASQTLERSPLAEVSSLALSWDGRCVIAGHTNGSVTTYAMHLPDY